MLNAQEAREQGLGAARGAIIVTGAYLALAVIVTLVCVGVL